jgi:hypothetical protein
VSQRAGAKPFRSQVASIAVVLSALVLLLSTSASCTTSSSLCPPTTRSAAETILTAWCTRYTQCDATRGTTAKCVEDRIGIAAVPEEDGCVTGCTDDTDECRRSSCKDERVETCRKASVEMACADQVKGPLVQFPDFCDSCFK